MHKILSHNYMHQVQSASSIQHKGSYAKNILVIIDYNIQYSLLIKIQ
jgi:hypothetical protein